MPAFKNLQGQTFGQLSVVRRAGRNEHSKTLWLCLCTCGEIKLIATCDLTNGDTKSCGCKRRRGRMFTTHGLYRTPLHTVWRGMKSRCYDPKQKSYKDYGGRGIEICERWRKDLLAFVADMGERPTPRHTIERVDNDGNYEPSNCRWATRAEQARNKRLQP